MRKIYFDITDIIRFARRSNRLTGIQRVQFNVINLLAAKHGGEHIRCLFRDAAKKTVFEFDPASRGQDMEFNAEKLLIDLGQVKSSSIFPSIVLIKTYLRSHARSKLHRVFLKTGIYLAAVFARSQLQKRELLPAVAVRQHVGRKVQLTKLSTLATAHHLVHMGSSWLFPETWQFAARHRQRGGDVVQYIYDLIPITHPHFMPAKEPAEFITWLNRAFDYASRFPCISRWVADDLLRYAGQQGRTASVATVTLAHEFIGYARNSEVTLPERLAHLAGKPFVFCVGTIEARKNGLSLLKVWRELWHELGERTPLLVFAGRYGRIGGDEFRDYVAAHAELAKLVVVVDGPSDQVLAWLYRNCTFTTYPSHVEGWGLPVGEAAWFGRYCVASQASSVPEVCGDLIDYVDPDDLQSIKAGILKPLLDPEYLRAKEAAIAVAPLRTWQDVADDLYDYIVKSPTI